VGYAISTTIVVSAIVALGVLLLSADGDDGPSGSSVAAQSDPSGGGAPAEGDLLPEGGLFPLPRRGVDSVREAAELAGCELESHRVKSKDHVKTLEEYVPYSSSPPTSGRHFPVPAKDGAYEVSPNVKLLVHTLEHSRVIVWFKRDLPARARASLKAFYDNDKFLLVLVPDTTNMPYDVAATAWNRNPRPNGTGRLLGCPEYGDDVFTALELFKRKNRGHGPERVL
jgi:hypothetical protein